MGVISGESRLVSLARYQNVVQTCWLDSLEYAKPDFIKLGVKGIEFEVVQGGAEHFDG